MDIKDIKIITPDDGAHYFFAYYDMRATGKMRPSRAFYLGWKSYKL